MALTFKISGDASGAVRDVKQLGEAAEDAGKDLDKLGDHGKKAGKEVSDGLKNASKEAGQSGREAAASFSGEFSDIGDFLQEASANAFGGFGLAGAAAGGAAALGIGLVTAELVRQQEETEKMKQRFSEMYLQAAEDGLNYISTAAIIANTNDLMFNTDRAGEWKSLQEDALKIGIDANTVALARNGHEESLAVVLAAIKSEYDNVKAAAEEQGTTAIRMTSDELAKLEQIRREYEGIGDLHASNSENLSNAQAIANGLHEEERAQIQRTKDAAQARYEAAAALYANPLRMTVELQDNTNPAAFRASVASRLGTITVPVQLGPGYGSPLP
jgi:vacuolar-type H+-ATPase subunit I/STV1